MDILAKISDIVWGLPTVFVILSVGAVLSFRLGFPQITRLREILKSSRGRQGAVSTALAATVGTGSITGVAAAIALGGPGAVFWLWVSAFFGMAVAYAEGVLSIKYRRSCPREGGIWFALRDGLGLRRLAAIYAGLTVLSSLGMGCMSQTSAAAEALETLGVPPLFCGLAMFFALIFCLCLRGFTEKLCGAVVPVLAGLYVLGAVWVILKNASALGPVMREIFSSALDFKGFLGGTAGAAISVGCRRGIFSNEAGLGTTAPVHGASAEDDPDRQGLMNMFEVFVDTFVICTLTALAILCSRADKSGIGGASTVVLAARSVFGDAAPALVSLSLAAFAAATAVGWSEIGLSGARFLSPSLAPAYKAVFVLAALFGSLTAPAAVLSISDITNGLMALPCLLAIVLLIKDVCGRR